MIDKRIGKGIDKGTDKGIRKLRSDVTRWSGGAIGIGGAAVAALSTLLLATSAGAQAATPAPVATAPVATALRTRLAIAERNFGGTAERMPPDKYSYKPTEAHLTFAAHMVHIADVNDTLCSVIGGVKAPTHASLAPTASREDITPYVKASFAYCRDALAGLTDAHLDEPVPFNGSQVTRAYAILLLSGDWSDHYAVTATYLRLNGILPPTARP